MVNALGLNIVYHLRMRRGSTGSISSYFSEIGSKNKIFFLS